MSTRLLLLLLGAFVLAFFLSYLVAGTVFRLLSETLATTGLHNATP